MFSHPRLSGLSGAGAREERFGPGVHARRGWRVTVLTPVREGDLPGPPAPGRLVVVCVEVILSTHDSFYLLELILASPSTRRPLKPVPEQSPDAADIREQCRVLDESDPRARLARVRHEQVGRQQMRLAPFH